jgi:hypothetical protein
MGAFKAIFLLCDQLFNPGNKTKQTNSERIINKNFITYNDNEWRISKIISDNEIEVEILKTSNKWNEVLVMNRKYVMNRISHSDFMSSSGNYEHHEIWEVDKNLTPGCNVLVYSFNGSEIFIEVFDE